MKTALLRTLYDRTITGLPVLGTPSAVASRFDTDSTSAADTGDRVVALYTGLCGMTGFVCGLPGLLMMPVTVPTNLAGVAALQLHMTAAVATLGGHDLNEPATRELCIGCLLEKVDESGKNSEEEEMVSRTGIKLLERSVRFAAEKAVKMTGKAARKIVLRKMGARRLPLIGGVLGAGSDAYVTLHVGRCAKDTFLS